MDLREVLLRFEQPKRKDRIIANSQWAVRVGIPTFAEKGEYEWLMGEQARLDHPEILMPRTQLPGTHAYSVYVPEKFTDYVQLESGLIVPSRVASDVRLPSKPYRPQNEIYAASEIDLMFGD